MISNLAIYLKRKAHDQCILPVQTHNSATWHLAKDFKRKPKEHEKRNGDTNAGYNIEARKASLIRERTKETSI